MGQVDANVLLRHFLGDHAEFSPRATLFFTEIANGVTSVEFGETTLFEVVFNLHRNQRRTRKEVAESIRRFLSFRNVRFPHRQRALTALDLFVAHNMDFGDAYIAALALESDGCVISFDRDFDRVPGLTRVEP